MAEFRPPPPPPPPPSSPPPVPATATNNPDPTQYWCYQCDKRVPIETLADNNSEIICFECKNGFVESISVGVHNREVSDEDTPAFGDEFLQVLRLIAQAAREDDEPPPPPSDRPSGDNDYLRIELDGWENGNVNVNGVEDEDEDEEEDPYHGDQARAQFVVHDDDDDVDDHEEEEDEEEDEEEEEIQNRNLEEEDEEDFVRRERRDVLRLRLRDFASRAASRRNRILDWAEILMGLEDQSIEFRLQVPGDNDDDDGGYVGNPGDYVDAAGYEALLQNLAENDTGGRRGAPPAAKSAVEKLQTVEVNSTNMEICAICKDRVFNNEDKIAKQLECGHIYHEDCIVPWLGSRNTCPICRYELPTDDPEYEEDRKKRLITMAATASGTDHGCSSSSGGDGDGGGD